MTFSQIILVAITLAMIGVTYLFGPLTAAQKEVTQVNKIEQPAVAFDYAEFKEKAIAELPENVVLDYENLKNSYESARNAKEKSGYLKSMSTLLKEYQPVVSAVILRELAEMEKTGETWTNAGDDLIQAYYQAGDPGLSSFLINQATECYEHSIALNPDDLETRIKLASTYMDGTNQVMKGVSILLEIIDKEPDNVSANLILGRYGIISGQFDKAVKRLENVLQQDSTNAEAYFYMAEAYNGLGDKAKAIELFKKCKTLVRNPEFALEIDNYIEKLKNS